ncbi:hypothetical protein BDN71DRAFT_1375415, partial [Pleurotus eryngii]
IPVPFSYTPSDDGIDENLLIFLHGLGDTHIPFAKLGRQLKLPQTAILSIRAPEKIPFLYEEAYQWYTSFDGLGELIERPDPTSAMILLSAVIRHFVRDCEWTMNRIHLFGFGQGGSVAVQYAIHNWNDLLLQQQTAESKPAVNGSPVAIISSSSLASVVSVSGPLLSYPTLSQKCSTPVAISYRLPPAEEALTQSQLTEFKKAFTRVEEVKLLDKRVGMPASRGEWEGIMKFWSDVLEQRRGEGLFEVMSG